MNEQGILPERRGRGRRAGLTHEEVVTAALAIVDDAGPAALSMRRLGSTLGVEAMTVQYHVGTKEALLDALVTHAFRAVLVTTVTGTSTTWRERLTALAHDIRSTLLEHPGLATLAATRAVATDESLDLLESLVAALHEDGLTPGQALELAYAVIGFVVAQTGVDAGVDRDARRAALLADSPRCRPTIAAGAKEPAWPGVDSFDVLLEAVLDRYAVLVDAGRRA